MGMRFLAWGDLAMIDSSGDWSGGRVPALVALSVLSTAVLPFSKFRGCWLGIRVTSQKASLSVAAVLPLSVAGSSCGPAPGWRVRGWGKEVKIWPGPEGPRGDRPHELVHWDPFCYTSPSVGKCPARTRQEADRLLLPA